MQIEKTTVINRIKAKYPNTNLSQTRMDAIADRLINKLSDDADETAIDTVIDDFNHFNPLSEIAKNDDRIRDLEAKARRNEPKPEPKPTDPPADAPDWFKTWTQTNEAKTKELEDKLSGFENSQKTKSLTDRFNSDERIKDVPDIMRRGFIPRSEDDYETSIANLTADFTKYNETYKVEKVGGDKPTGQQGGEAKPKEASKEQVDALVSKISI